MKIISRAEAKAQGLKRFFTGKPCPHGHIAERLVSSKTCVVCTRQRADAWGARVSGTVKPCKYGHISKRTTNGACMECERISAVAAYHADPEAARAKNRENYAKNPEPIRHRRREWGKANREQETAASKRRLANNPDKVAEANARRRERIRERYRTDPEFRAAVVARGAAWDANNPESLRERGRRSYRKRSQDLEFRLACAVRNQVRHALVNGKKFTKSLETIGCTIADLVLHVEAQFRDGMTWDNWAKAECPGGWELDHRKAIGIHDLSKPDEFSAAFHYSNLQPLPIEEHRQKSRIDHAMVREMKRRNSTSA